MFEQLVRPSQKPQVVTTRRIVSVREVVEVTPAGVVWGKPGTLPTAIEVPPEESPAGINFVVKKPHEHTLDYGKSTTQKVKVTNPDDPSQYVVVERLKKAKFTDEKPETMAVYRVNPDGTVDTTRDIAYSEGGSSIETVTPTPGYHSETPSNTFSPVQVKDNTYGISWPHADNEVIVSEKGPDS